MVPSLVKVTVPCAAVPTPVTVSPAFAAAGGRLSASVSFVSTLMTVAPLSSATVAVSSFATGASLTAVTLTFTVAVAGPP